MNLSPEVIEIAEKIQKAYDHKKEFLDKSRYTYTEPKMSVGICLSIFKKMAPVLVENFVIHIVNPGRGLSE